VSGDLVHEHRELASAGPYYAGTLWCDPASYMARPTYSGDVAPQKRPTITRPRATGVQLGGDVARDMIMFGATRVFAARGYRAASVEDLLEAGQVSRRTFYRFFKSKDDVALAMYALGTSSLIEACRRAIAQETGLIAQLERCLDIHLGNARDRGRLVFVLGGEAQSRESPLYARRMEVHDALVDLLHTSRPSSARLDPLLLRTLLLGVEAITRRVLEEGDEGRRITEASIARARRVMMRIMTATIAGTGAHVAPLPTIG
jgi:AcrR family transcriptional regulator